MSLSLRMLAALVAVISVAGCGSDNSPSDTDESWPATVVQDADDTTIGTWDGRLGSLTIECSGDPDGAYTIELAGAEGWSASLPRPDDGEPIGDVTVRGPDGRETTWDKKGVSTDSSASPQTDSLPHWGADGVVTTPGGATLDEYRVGEAKFSLRDGALSCTEGE